MGAALAITDEPGETDAGPHGVVVVALRGNRSGGWFGDLVTGYIGDSGGA